MFFGKIRGVHETFDIATGGDRFTLHGHFRRFGNRAQLASNTAYSSAERKILQEIIRHPAREIADELPMIARTPWACTGTGVERRSVNGDEQFDRATAC